MSNQQRQIRDQSKAAQARSLLRFYLPLALTHIMMSGGTPIVNAGIARRPAPVEGLAAFAVAFAISVFINSMIFGIEPASIALIKGERSAVKVARFSIVLGASLGLIILAVSLTQLSDLVFEGFFDLSPNIAKMSAWTLCAFSPLPLLLAIRSIGRGILTGLSRTGLVGWGTLLRLIAMILVVLLGVLGLPVPGPILGALAFCAGILSESLFVAIGAFRNIKNLPGDSADGVGMSYRSITRFIAPVLTSGLFVVGINIMMNAILSRTDDAEVSISSFSVVRSISWFITSVLIAFQQLAIARNSLDERKAVIRFSGMLILGVTIVLMVISYTPIGYWIASGLIGVTGHTLDAVLHTLLFTPMIPVLLGTRSYLRGAAIRDNQPGSVLVSSIMSLILAGLAGLLIKDVFVVGAVVAILMWAVANAAEALVLLIMRWRFDHSRLPAPGDGL